MRPEKLTEPTKLAFNDKYTTTINMLKYDANRLSFSARRTTCCSGQQKFWTRRVHVELRPDKSHPIEEIFQHV